MKKKIAVLFGGCSTEYEVSLKSAVSVLTNLNEKKYDILMVGITREGKWLRYFGTVEGIASDTWHQAPSCRTAFFSPEKGSRCLLEFMEDGRVVRTPCDAVLPAMHGNNCEDGRLQGLLELSGIPFVGCGTSASAVSMDKDIAHKLAQAAGISVPKCLVFRQGDKLPVFLKEACKLRFPLFVKPACGGSSVGLSRIDKPSQLPKALVAALNFDSKAVIEEAIPGFEVGCAVIGNPGTERGVFVGEVDEIELKSNVVFDYAEKYSLTKTTIHLPARLDQDTKDRIKEAGKAIYTAFGCKGLARVDFFLTPEGEVVFNEINTFPGFTAGSRYPRMLQQAGLSYENILDLLIACACDTEPGFSCEEPVKDTRIHGRGDRKVKSERKSEEAFTTVKVAKPKTATTAV